MRVVSRVGAGGGGDRVGGERVRHKVLVRVGRGLLVGSHVEDGLGGRVRLRRWPVVVVVEVGREGVVPRAGRQGAVNVTLHDLKLVVDPDVLAGRVER